MMKKILLAFSLLLTFTITSAQEYSSVDKLLQKLEKRYKDLYDSSDYDLVNKRYYTIQKFEDHDERFVIEFKDDKNITLIELFDDKETDQTSSNIFTGDYIRKKNVVSVRADMLEGKKIGMPLTYTFYLMKVKDIWYLKDSNTNVRWIEHKSPGNKK